MIILGILVFGFCIGWLAQVVLGQGTALQARTLIAGIGGSFVGGFVYNLIFNGDLNIQPSGLIGSFVGAVIVLAVWAAIDKSSAKKSA